VQRTMNSENRAATTATITTIDEKRHGSCYADNALSPYQCLVDDQLIISKSTHLTRVENKMSHTVTWPG